MGGGSWLPKEILKFKVPSMARNALISLQKIKCHVLVSILLSGVGTPVKKIKGYLGKNTLWAKHNKSMTRFQKMWKARNGIQLLSLSSLITLNRNWHSHVSRGAGVVSRVVEVIHVFSCAEWRLHIWFQGGWIEHKINVRKSGCFLMSD